MIDIIRDIKDDLMDRKAKWIPITITGIGLYVLLNIWPAFAIGISVGIAGTWGYRMYYNARTTGQYQS
jgi:hypothetical protein